MVGATEQRLNDDEFTFKDYYSWSSDERCELIDGRVYSMSPAPTTSHQEISTNLSGIFWNFFNGKKCKVFHAPFDVRFPLKNEPDDDIRTVVQPDISVICDLSKLDEKGCRGAPDLIVEIISVSSASKDHIKKKALYERHGVREYWLVNPLDRVVVVYCLEADKKFGAARIFVCYEEGLLLESSIFPGLTVDFNSVFPPVKIVVCEPLAKYLKGDVK
ncbi:MAG: Uma2 family endonuclease [Candidatus Riflebacteria bacterium]|nr:Uma2 family endonuclease [Candidatus Riflebacteria bacterium]